MATERAKKVTTLAIGSNGEESLRLQLIYESDNTMNGSSVWYDISPKHLRLLKAAVDAVLEANCGPGIT